MRRLCTAANLPEAYLLLYELEAAGIRARVFNENAQGAVGELPFTHTYPEIWIVDEAQRDRAVSLVAAHEAQPVASAALRCGRCGDDSPANFELCWRCGEPLPR